MHGRIFRFVPLFAGLGASAACGGKAEVDPYATTTGQSTTSAESGETGGDSAGESDTSTGGDRLDIGSTGGTMTGETGAMNGCSKVDFLFVIDNSGSMGDEQTNLVQSFPGFLSTIMANVEADDYHIMVVDSDASGLAGGSSSSTCQGNGGMWTCTCSPAPTCCDAPCMNYGPTAICNGAPACNQPPPPVLDMCDEALGGGRNRDLFFAQCFDPAMGRFLTDATPDLTNVFGCVAEVGTSGDGNEQVMQAIQNSLTPPLTDAGGCNEGFLRDDAILVVTFITDEDDNGSMTTAQMVYDAVVDAKNGDPMAIVMLGLFGDWDQSQPQCSGFGADPAPTLLDMLNRFPTTVRGSVCEADYTPFFQAAVSTIDLTCDNFVPPD
jgi:hypothetical protein